MFDRHSRSGPYGCHTCFPAASTDFGQILPRHPRMSTNVDMAPVASSPLQRQQLFLNRTGCLLSALHMLGLLEVDPKEKTPPPSPPVERPMGHCMQAQ